MCEKIEVSYSSYPREEEIKYPTEEAAIASIDYLWQQDFVHPEKHKRYRPRDSQKTKVYRWEHIAANELGPKEIHERGHEISTLERKREHLYIQMFLSEVCLELGEEKPELTFRSGGSTSSAGYAGIKLLPCHCTRTVLLHELAHILHRYWGTKTNGKKHQAHGKEFMGIFAYLLIRFGGIDKTAIIRHARDRKVNLLLPEQYWDWKEKESKAA
jgi:hypothetical protein